jgi:hypothetical protein
MNSNPSNKELQSELKAISKQLECIEEHMGWMIRPEQRFQIGQRVEWSRKAIKAGLPTRKKSNKGIIKAVNSFSIVVHMDGVKKPRTYHHAFFNPVTGQKLF